MIDGRIDLDAAVAMMAEAVDTARARDGVGHVVVPGGRSPTRLYAALAAAGLPDATWRLHLSDERCVPADDPRRNAPSVAAALRLAPGHPARPSGPPALDDDAEAARRHAARLADVPDFAIVVLGLGADGHVASLLPGDPRPLAPDAPDALVVVSAAHDPPRRITLSAARLARTPTLLLVVDGDDKDAAVDAVEVGADVPANRVVGPRRLLVDLRG